MRRLFALLLVACGSPPEPAVPPPVIHEPPPLVTPITPPTGFVSPHLPFGVPKGGRDVILDRKYFVVGFDPRIHLARWVAWKLERADLGSIARTSAFHPDPSQPWVQDSYFVKTGYDRGHLCPSADRTATEEANRSTFVLTNVHPQLHELNAGPWEDLEKKERELARAGHVVYVVAGGLFDASDPLIMSHEIPVPESSFKVIVVLEPGEGASAVTASTQTIAAIMPNDASVKRRPYADFTTTIRSIEEKSGYDFEPELPRALQDVLEARVTARD